MHYSLNTVIGVGERDKSPPCDLSTFSRTNTPRVKIHESLTHSSPSRIRFQTSTSLLHSNASEAISHRLLGPGYLLLYASRKSKDGALRPLCPKSMSAFLPCPVCLRDQSSFVVSPLRTPRGGFSTCTSPVPALTPPSHAWSFPCSHNKSRTQSSMTGTLELRRIYKLKGISGQSLLLAKSPNTHGWIHWHALSASALPTDELGSVISSGSMQRPGPLLDDEFFHRQDVKKHTNFRISRMPGDGSCLFHAVAFGACQAQGVPIPSLSVQRELAFLLRQKVMDELERRKSETEWFIEGDFDSYVLDMRQPHAWGGEPELLMLTHVLRMGISVYIFDPERKGKNGTGGGENGNDAAGVFAIASYGQEYGGGGIKASDHIEDVPAAVISKHRACVINVLYNGHNHYDAMILLDADDDADGCYSERMGGMSPAFCAGNIIK